MELPLLASTFATVFLAELGDKTQLAIVTISGTSSRSGAVFAGSSAALVLASLLGAGAGGSLSAVIPPDALQLAASVGFLVIGTRLLLKAGSETEANALIAILDLGVRAVPGALAVSRTRHPDRRGVMATDAP
ncbi:TMEM165/GDT1 family protein [Synechococcus sp. CB0101]|uniref:TMEM165/GDT1 family protein n=1 Tax=Synechococcus sp. CB0101 TaxID=232348 RepID=UPI001FEFB9BD|nr:TMEM165/GDT1 family protein [Synechococcus sp. CB0101]